MTGSFGLAIAEQGLDGDDIQWAGVAKILGPKWSQLPALTVGLLGVQVMWSIEMSYAPPYLTSLGMSKSHMAMVFLAGPLSGLIVQPLIGVIADNSKSRFGRRRPYMLLGVLITSASMLLLGFTPWFSSIFTRIGSSANEAFTVFLAIWAIYCIDFAINVVQAVDRALLVDTLPTTRQATGNAWAARMLGIGSVVGFFIGNVDLTGTFAFFGNTELQILAVLGSLLLIAAHGMTAWCVKEKVLVSSSRAPKGFRQELVDIWENILTLPRVIRQICVIQFFAWIAWNPILFYTTTYVGDLHRRASPVPQDVAAAMALDEEATRLGSRALLYSSLLSLAANFIMPFLILKAQKAPDVAGSKPRFSFAIMQMHLCDLWAFSHLLVALCMGATLLTSSVSGATFLITVTGFSWAISQWAPYSLLAEEILSGSSSEADDGGSIHLMDTRTSRKSTEPRLGNGHWTEDDERFRLVGGDDEDADDDTARGFTDRPMEDAHSSRASSFEADRPNPLMANTAARQSRPEINPINGDTGLDDPGYGGEEDDDINLHPSRPASLEAKAGVILGIHNLSLVFPQFLVTAMSSAIFAIFEPSKSVLHGQHPGNIKPEIGTLPVESATNGTTPLLFGRDALEDVRQGPNAVAIIFRIGGITAFVSFVLAWRLAKELKRK
ncbi:MFS general substrate transporter [Rickenella mellea]|uniref:MFS general substrate transporter n=1 Tax=Rickenella mellea TaxID=50990 RepID=A0A4Y7Q052_9AGAM|nr:MFS general substrate transporter [Rickenella mellea]